MMTESNQNLIPLDWRISSTSDPEQVQHLANKLELDPLIISIMFQRGLTTEDEIGKFVHPSLKNLYDPFLMLGIKSAVDTILKAIERGDRVVIHGDYDVDGISSVSLLYSYLRDFGANVDYFIPRREQEGYGISATSVEKFAASGVNLMISTDCGISNTEEIALARNLGMQVIILDHHQIPPNPPVAEAVVNPLQEADTYPFKPLAAVGVVFSLAVAMRAELRRRGIFNSIPEPDLRQYLDLVALGTVADVMPLIDQNRILVFHGLRILASRRRPGIAALMDKVNLPEGLITTNDISFKLAPRLNAAGRVDDASLCVELLTTNSFAEAVRLTSDLESLNIERKDEERQALDSAMKIANEQHHAGRKVLVLAGKDWHHGVLGIVASRVVDTFHKPAILLRLDDDGIAKGSARAVDGLDLVEIFQRAHDLLLTYGGHKLAAGLSLRAELLPQLQDRLDNIITNIEATALHSPAIEISAVLGLDDLTPNFMCDLVKMAPFGSGNPEPAFLTQHVIGSSAAVVGRNHIRARLSANGKTFPAFGFSLGHLCELVNSHPIDIVFSPRILKRRGIGQLELFLRDIRDARDHS